MPLVFAAITPHPPLLIPAIGKEALLKLDKTALALARLEEDLYLAKPEVICIISPHGKLWPDAFTINFCKEYKSDLREFGDLTTRLKFKGGSHWASRLWQDTKHAPFKSVVISEPKLDYGVAVPLYYLAKHLSTVGILPIGFATDLPLKTHLDFGTLLKEFIMKSNQRIAVIASADLSHALASDAPAGFNARAAEFDRAVQELLATRNTVGLVQLDPELIAGAAECGLRSILILLGILRNMHYTFEALAYEAPFGVGYLTGNFIL